MAINLDTLYREFLRREHRPSRTTTNLTEVDELCKAVMRFTIYNCHQIIERKERAQQIQDEHWKTLETPFADELKVL